MAKEEKTNVMRLLDAAGIAYVGREYDPETVDGKSVALALGEDPETVFKTLIAENQKKERFAFCVPVTGELDLKKAAKAVGAKSIEMIPQKELLPSTGYVHGGCSPIGLKKPYPVTIDETAQLFERVFVSGGRRGFQVGLSPEDLARYLNASFADLAKY
ncbi:MAG: Cys-tRNA(Pro) deacylase [Candidatus Enteromonas sp.]|nr:Cys-tRNA(Pro) deacylase [bacterium]MDD6917445.1 Cys-tRNA(Pro) deacylase [bacterium]MDY6100767.1 Cys-tRNA(Pro) deacylase [Candidatus Enteromonas sp.]